MLAAILSMPVKSSETSDVSKISKSKNTIMPEDIPALSFSEDGVIKNCVSTARAAGFRIGTAVKCAKTFRGIKKNAAGHITDIDTEIIVQWCVNSAVDGSDRDHEMPPKRMTIASLTLNAHEHEKPENLLLRMQKRRGNLPWNLHYPMEFLGQAERPTRRGRLSRIWSKPISFNYI